MYKWVQYLNFVTFADPSAHSEDPPLSTYDIDQLNVTKKQGEILPTLECVCRRQHQKPQALPAIKKILYLNITGGNAGFKILPATHTTYNVFRLVNCE
jgi:hypothetical protein